MPSGNDKVNCETVKVIPRLSAPLVLSNLATREILLESGTASPFRNWCKSGDDSVKSFKSCNIFDTKHLEVST